MKKTSVLYEILVGPLDKDLQMLQQSGFNRKRVEFVSRDRNWSGVMKGDDTGQTESPGGDSGRNCKETRNTLPTFNPHQLVHQKNPVFWIRSFANDTSLHMKGNLSFGTLRRVNFYQTTRRNSPEGSHLHTRRHKNLKYHLYTFLTV
jgi:hypothetical protein